MLIIKLNGLADITVNHKQRELSSKGEVLATRLCCRTVICAGILDKHATSE